jgi:hypothetical protein
MGPSTPIARAVTYLPSSVLHSPALIDAIGQTARNAAIELTAIELIKEFGQTAVAGREPLDQPPWRWPKR